jgi:mannose-6-phosphate isomerase-like protein (cupin superfamily)
MLKTAIVAFVLVLAMSSLAQPPASPLPATVVTRTDIQAFINALPRSAVSDKPIRTVDVGGYHVGVYGVYRPKTIQQEANLHETKVTEIYYILSGSATLVTGGTIPNPHPLSPGSGAMVTMQGARIDGGVSRQVTKGDVIVIPAYTPHWWSSQAGDLEYLIFRPDPEGKIPLK